MTAYLRRCAEGRKSCLSEDLKRYCGEENVPANPDKKLLRKMYKAKNTRLFSEKQYRQDPHRLRSATVVVEEDNDTSHWYDDVVPIAPPTNKYVYRGHGGLNPEQEFLMFLCKLHHNVPNGFLAERWLNCPDELTCRMVRNIICMWTAALYYVFRAEKFWCDPDVLEMVKTKLQRDGGETTPDLTGDCSCTPMEGISHTRRAFI